MIRITDEIREAAKRLLAKHNAEQAARVEARYEADLARAEALAAQRREQSGGNWAPDKEYIRKHVSAELPAEKDARQRLEAIVNGKRKLIDGSWWRDMYGDVVDRARLAKIAAMADPARNDKEHERATAAAKLAAAQARRPPGLRPPPPPLPPASE